MTRFLNLPGAPILLPRVAGSSDPAQSLRVACRQAIESVLPPVGRVIVLAAGSLTRTWDADTPYDLGRLVGHFRQSSKGLTRQEVTPGRMSDHSDLLPLPLAVARGLMDVDHDRLRLITIADGHLSDPVITELLQPDDHDLVITVGDGSALGKPGGPDVVHPQAEEFDAALVDAWRSGEPSRLAGLDRDLANAVGAVGAPAWHLAAQISAIGAGSYRPKIIFAEAPFGVFYLVASWA